MKRKQLSFYVTIKGITVRLKNVSLRRISHVADRLASLEHADELKIMVTSVTQHCDYQSEDEKVFMSVIKKALEHNARHKDDLLPIDLVIAAIREEFPNFYIKRNSNAIATVQSQSKTPREYRVFAGLLDDIVLHAGASDRPLIARLNSIAELIEHIKLEELELDGIKEI